MTAPGHSYSTGRISDLCCGHALSLVAAFELAVAAYGISFPNQRSNLRPPALGAQRISHWTTREVPIQ